MMYSEIKEGDALVGNLAAMKVRNEIQLAHMTQIEAVHCGVRLAVHMPPFHRGTRGVSWPSISGDRELLPRPWWTPVRRGKGQREVQIKVNRALKGKTNNSPTVRHNIKWLPSGWLMNHSSWQPQTGLFTRVGMWLKVRALACWLAGWLGTWVKTVGLCQNYILLRDLTRGLGLWHLISHPCPWRVCFTGSRGETAVEKVTLLWTPVSLCLVCLAWLLSAPRPLWHWTKTTPLVPPDTDVGSPAHHCENWLSQPHT